MRIKLAENIPVSAADVADDLGHDAHTVTAESLVGATAWQPQRIVVLRVDVQDARTVTEAVRTFLTADDLGDLTGCVVVVRGALARVRRPE